MAAPEREIRRDAAEAEQLEQLRFLHEVARLATTARTWDELLETVVDGTRDALHADVSSLYLLDRDGAYLTLAATNGLDRFQIGRAKVPYGEGVTGASPRRGAPRHPRRRRRAALPLGPRHRRRYASRCATSSAVRPSFERSFQAGSKSPRAQLEQRPVQFLYRDGDEFHFMDTDNYDQFVLRSDQLGEATRFLKDGMTLDRTSYQDETIGVELPVSVDLAVVETEPGFAGDTQTGARKPATTETRLVVRCRVFVESSDADSHRHPGRGSTRPGSDGLPRR